MTTYWITFEDGTQGACQGQTPYDAVTIAEKVSGKKVKLPEGKKLYTPGVAEEIAKMLPYPARPMIWEFDHPVSGLTPYFCYDPKKCAGQASCRKDPCCTN